MSSLVPLVRWTSCYVSLFKDIDDLKQVLEEFKPHPLNKVYEHIRKYRNVTLEDAFRNKHIIICPGNGRLDAVHIFCDENMGTPYDCYILKSIDCTGTYEITFEIATVAPLLYSEHGLFCPAPILEAPLYNWIKHIIYGSDDIQVCVWYLYSTEIKYTLSQLFEMLTGQDLINLVLTIFFGTDKRDIVEEFIPNFDYKTAIYNYLKDTKRYFISALVDNNEKKYLYTSCCQTKIRDNLFELMIEDSKGCPFCKTKYSLCDNGYIVYDLDDLDFKCCAICNEFNAIGFVIDPENESKIYQCNHHSLEEYKKRGYKDTCARRTNGKYSVNKYPDSYVFGLLPIFQECNMILNKCIPQKTLIVYRRIL